MKRLGLAAAMMALVLGLLVRPAGTASQNGATPPKPSGLAGQLLVAAEEMSDPRFVRTVILMVRHDATGAMGLVVNRPIGDVPITKLIEGVGLDGAGVQGDIRLHYGGPVERRQVLTIHTTDYAIEGTLRVTGDTAVTGNPEILRAMGRGKGPKRHLVVLGYAGWAPGQLEGEMKAGGWISVPADAAIVFDDKYDTKWERAMARRRVEI
jgi:putative transcriptional regulator